ncbi:hypothetical protein [Pinibacter aurantiacus]|nr:hypothetical protein [Pinibacter aurantiacus]
MSIIRRNNWEDFSEDSNISLQEWLDYVASDNEFLKVDETILYPFDPEEDWRWNHPMIEDKKFGLPILSYSKTFKMISIKNPDYWMIEKMIAMAKQMNARVVGEEGEFYDEDFLQMIAPDE